METRPSLSICIPTYNRGSFLDQTLNSIVSQLSDDVQIVVSDNASTDNTPEIIEYYRSKFPQLTHFRHDTNVGADLNYLKSVELANGKYCWLFGSDDIMKPGAIDLVLQEIKTNYDVYLCGFTLCTYQMVPICDHLILNKSCDSSYDLSDVNSRIEYFKQALTTTAFFSFLGSLIVNKKKWDAVTIDRERFVGSLWVHVAKIFGMLPAGLKVQYLKYSLLLKRGDNDSFIGQGIAHRIGVSVYGYQDIADYFFGADSVEADNIHRVVKFEWPLAAFASYKLSSETDDAQNALNKVFNDTYYENTWQDIFARFIYKSNIRCHLYIIYISGIRKIKQALKRLLYAKT